jgi:hypothetical protein
MDKIKSYLLKAWHLLTHDVTAAVGVVMLVAPELVSNLDGVDFSFLGAHTAGAILLVLRVLKALTGIYSVLKIGGA